MQPVRIDASAPPTRAPGSEEDCRGFMNKASLGLCLEELVLQDTRLQRRTGTLMRKTRRTLQRKLLAGAIAKMRKAAGNKILSAVTGSLLTALSSLDALSPSTGKSITEQAREKIEVAVAQGFSRYNSFDMLASEQQAEAGDLQNKAKEISDSMPGIDEWLTSARDLEKRMLDCLDTLIQGEHRARLDTIDKIGA